MANPKLIIQLALGKSKDEPESTEECGICELIERVFTTRNLVHFAHWNTKSFASHMALGELYDGIVDEVDNLVETYQGEFGLVEGLCTERTELPKDIVATIQADSDWIKANRKAIANGSTTIENLLDGLTGVYNKVLYKLKNLK
jgi:hypothetical protein